LAAVFALKIFGDGVPSISPNLNYYDAATSADSLRAGAVGLAFFGEANCFFVINFRFLNTNGTPEPEKQLCLAVLPRSPALPSGDFSDGKLKVLAVGEFCDIRQAVFYYFSVLAPTLPNRFW
jgi:hypothetical protein